MRTSKFVYFLLIAAASQAHAGAGQTGAGVSTTIGSADPTAATQGVQSQSSNFVQSNQTLANGTTGTATGATLGTGTATRNGQAPGSDPNNPGKPGDPNNPSGDPNAANAKPAVPAAPPAPPPEYVSNIKKVDHTATATAVVPTVVTSGEKSVSTAKSTATADSDPSIVTAPGIQRQAAAAQQKPTPRTADPAARAGAERVAEVTGSSGGSGDPPDSYAFYIGLIIAGALLAFAAAMFLRVEKGVAR